MATKTELNEAHFQLPAELVVEQAADLHEQLGAVPVGDETVVIDASAVNSVDTAGLQLLLAFAARARSGGGGVQWLSGSDELRAAVDVSELGDLLKLD